MNLSFGLDLENSTSEPTLMSATFTTFTLTTIDASCNGNCDGQASMTVSSGFPPYTYNWSFGAVGGSSVNNLCGGSYMVTVTDANGFSQVQPFTINQPNVLTVSTTSTPASCNGCSDGSILATVNGGTPAYTYVWSSGLVGNPATQLSAGVYCVTVSDVNGCTVASCDTVTEPAPISNLMITEIMYNPPESGTDSLEYIELYNSGNTTINLNGYSFAQGVSHTFGNLSIPANSYFVIAVDTSAFYNVFGYSADDEWTSGGLSNGGEDIIIIDNNANPIDTVDYDDNAPWPSGSGNGQPDGGGASLILCSLNSNNNNGSNWAASSNSVGVSINGLPVLASPGSPNTCASPLNNTITKTDESCVPGCDATASINTTGGVSPYTYIWSNGATTQNLTNLCAGNYNVTTTDANGSTIVDTVTIINSPSYNIIFTVVDASSSTANDGSITTSLNGGVSPFTFIWSDGITTQNRTNLASGTYCVTTTDALGCTETGCATVLSPATLQFGINQSDVLCHGDSNGYIALNTSGGVAPYTYSWSNGGTTDSIGNLSTGTYAVTVFDANSLDSIMIFTISQPSPLLVSTISTPTSCLGCSDGSILANATGGVPVYTYVWTSGQVGNPATQLAAGHYCVTVNDVNGCTVSSCDTVFDPGPLANLVITEIMYNPPESGTDSLEYIEFVNAGSTSITLSGFSFGEGVTYTFGSESLAAGEFYVIAVDSSAFRNVFGISPNAQWTSGGLSNGGEDITLVDQFGRTVDSVNYDDNSPWPSGSSTGQPDGGGSSIELIAIALDNNMGSNWQASTQIVPGIIINGDSLYGSPGQSNVAVGITEEKTVNSFMVFPNPTKDVVNIQVKDYHNEILRIHDIQGKILFQQKLINERTELNLNAFHQGIYFIEIGGKIQKLVKLD